MQLPYFQVLQNWAQERSQMEPSYGSRLQKRPSLISRQASRTGMHYAKMHNTTRRECQTEKQTKHERERERDTHTHIYIYIYRDTLPQTVEVGLTRLSWDRPYDFHEPQVGHASLDVRLAHQLLHASTAGLHGEEAGPWVMSLNTWRWGSGSLAVALQCWVGSFVPRAAPV